MRERLVVAAVVSAVLLSATAWGQEEARLERGLQHEVGVSVGVLPVDAFSTSVYGQLGYTLHFSDTLAWQVARGAFGGAFSTGLRQQLERDFGVSPTTFEQVQFFFGSDVLWKPTFLKFLARGGPGVKAEGFLALGASGFKYTSALRPALNVGAGVRVLLGEHFTVRLDVGDEVVLFTGLQPRVANMVAVNLSLGFTFGG